MLFSTALRLVAPTSVANKSSQPSSGIISECHPQIFYSHGKEILPMPERKRFAYDQINELWQGDLSHGPTIRVHGKAQKTFLIAYIDDCSRFVPYAQFFPSEKFDGLRIVTKEAVLRCGKPKRIYSDNG
ncbi:hypothetical protein AA905_16495, partial [Geobacillus stearothermophilus]